MDHQEEDYNNYSEEESSQHPSITKKKRKRENNKRFSDEQVKFLESVFNGGPKLEPRKKLQLASDIGLEPRQVSIWFQNKRARWKTKQLEQEYKLLKTKFDELYQKYDSLKKEKENLFDQFNKLRRLLGNSCNDEHMMSSKNESEDISVRDLGYRDEAIKENKEDKLYKENDSKYLGQEDELEVVNFSGQEWNLLASDEQQFNLLPTECLLDELCCPSSWWEL